MYILVDSAWFSLFTYKSLYVYDQLSLKSRFGLILNVYYNIEVIEFVKSVNCYKFKNIGCLFKIKVPVKFVKTFFSSSETLVQAW